MILIDSSCWVEAYRRKGAPTIRAAVAEAVESGAVATCGVIRVEVLSFIARPREYKTVSEDFAALHELPVGTSDFERAVSIGRSLRANGTTVPATDLIIAAVAIGADAELLHADRHFETIAAVSALRQRSLAAIPPEPAQAAPAAAPPAAPQPPATPRPPSPAGTGARTPASASRRSRPGGRR